MFRTTGFPQTYVGETGTSILGAKATDNSNVSLVPMTPSGSYASADDYFRTNYYAKIQSTFKNTVLLEDECSTEGQYFGVQQVGCVKYVYTVESDGVTLQAHAVFHDKRRLPLYLHLYGGGISLLGASRGSFIDGAEF